MSMSQEFQNLLEEKGTVLKQLGLSEIALERIDALLAVQLFRKTSIPILGGDVYFKHGEGVEIAYANWHSDQRAGEGRDQFVMRSCLETENYIRNFPPSDAVPLFVLVPATK